MTQEEFDESVLKHLVGEDWDNIKKGLANDIYHSQASAFDAADWGGVQKLKGFAEGILHVMTLRENLVRTMQAEKSNADL